MRYFLIAAVALVAGCAEQTPQSVEGATVRLAGSAAGRRHVQVPPPPAAAR